MKAISKKTFEVTIVAPETAEEDQEIQRLIREVRQERIEPDSWKTVDNRPNPRVSDSSSQT